jgi:hypothetical protein
VAKNRRTDELVRQEQNCLEAELSVVKVEEVFKGRAEEGENHSVVITFGAKPSDEGKADTAGEGLPPTRGSGLSEDSAIDVDKRVSMRWGV